MLLLMSNSIGRKKAPAPLFRSMLEPQAPAACREAIQHERQQQEEKAKTLRKRKLGCGSLDRKKEFGERSAWIHHVSHPCHHKVLSTYDASIESGLH